MAEIKTMRLEDLLGLISGGSKTLNKEGVDGRKSTMLTLDGQGDRASFVATFEKSLDAAMETAEREGNDIELCVHGTIFVSSLKPKADEPKKGFTLPTFTAIFKAMIAGSFKPITDYSGVMGIEGDGFIWDAPDFSVVIDLTDEGYRFEVIGPDGETIAMSPRAVSVNEAIGTLETLQHKK